MDTMFDLFNSKKNKEIEALLERSEKAARDDMLKSRFLDNNPKEWMRFSLTGFLNRNFYEKIAEDPLCRDTNNFRDLLVASVHMSCWIVDYCDREKKFPERKEMVAALYNVCDRGGLNPWAESDMMPKGSSIPRTETADLICDFATIAVEEFEPLTRAVKESLEKPFRTSVAMTEEETKQRNEFRVYAVGLSMVNDYVQKVNSSEWPMADFPTIVCKIVETCVNEIASAKPQPHLLVGDGYPDDYKDRIPVLEQMLASMQSVARKAIAGEHTNAEAFNYISILNRYMTHINRNNIKRANMWDDLESFE
jgi:hypothetical protein